jgi:YHS domain-containing protein
MKKLPCIDCISLPICRMKLIKRDLFEKENSDKDFKYYFLSEECSLLYKYLNSGLLSDLKSSRFRIIMENEIKQFLRKSG